MGSRATRRVITVFGLGFLALNGVAYRQARALTHFAPPGHRTPRPERLSVAEKAETLLFGVEVPRPENQATPAQLGLAYETLVYGDGRGTTLEAWLVRAEHPRGTVILFHGHAATKDSELHEAQAFHDMGLNAFLVDFRGSGGSSGNETTIGFREAQDVTNSYRYVDRFPGTGPVVLYGASMGAAAILKAVADDGLQPRGLILECPFDTLAGTVRHRFTSFGVPSFPLAELLVFWGGAQEGFDAFSYRPVDLAAHVDRPTLLMNGGSDPYVRRDEARAIFRALRGPKRLRFFPGVGHDSCLRGHSGEWKAAVRVFLEGVLRAPSGTPIAPTAS